jgi:hypothetical protein
MQYTSKIYKTLIWPKGKRPLGRPRCRWVHNIRVDVGEIRWGDVDWLRIGTSGELL